MSRSFWAVVLGVGVFAVAAVFSVGPGEPAQPVRIHAEQASYVVPIVHHIVPVQTPALRHPARPAPATRHRAVTHRAVTHRAVTHRAVTHRAVTHRGRSAARVLALAGVVRLAPGAGVRQPAGSGRVRVLQRRLARLGFAPGPVDGRYGPRTTAAVERFQSAYGLNTDGIVGARSAAALNADAATTPAALRPGEGYQSTAGAGRVRVLQRRLARLGFAPGPIDGRYGPLTTHAVERFQSARRLAVNGVVAGGTLRALFTVQRRSPVTVSTHPHPQSPRPVPAHSTPPVSAHPHTTVPARSTTPVEAAPVRSGHSPGLPIVAVLLALAAAAIAVSLLRSGRTRGRERRELALGEPIPHAFASDLADVRDADPGTGGYGR